MNAPHQFRRRLLDLGFIPGAVVGAVRRGPGGDPIAFRICGSIICLRSEDAKRILIRPTGGAPPWSRSGR